MSVPPGRDVRFVQQLPGAAGGRLLGALFLGERLSAIAFAGMAMILAGVGLASL